MKPKQKSSQTEMAKILLIVLGIGIGLFIICKMTKKEGLGDDPAKCKVAIPCYGTPDSTTDQSKQLNEYMGCATDWDKYMNPTTHEFDDSLSTNDMPINRGSYDIDGRFYCKKGYWIKTTADTTDKDDPIQYIQDVLKYCKKSDDSSNCRHGWMNDSNGGICNYTDMCVTTNKSADDTKCLPAYTNFPHCDTCDVNTTVAVNTDKNTVGALPFICVKK